MKLEDRLIAEMVLTENGCWEWQGSRTEDGYGQTSVAGKHWLVHRLMYELFNGPITPDKPHVLHSCDNPPCGNPEHLRTGTNAENVREAFDRGRRIGTQAPWEYAAGRYIKQGTNGIHHVLSVEDVRRVRALHAEGVSYASLAQMYRISRSAVSQIVRKITYKNVV